jgi:putative aminopeptidase FrvX
MQNLNFELIEQLGSVRATSGDEKPMADYIIEYVHQNQNRWNHKPIIHTGGELFDAVVLEIGNPKAAIFAHLDSIGFTVSYQNKLVRVGSPVLDEGILLVGSDEQGEIEGKLIFKNDQIYIDFHREIERGITLTFKPNFRLTEQYLQNCYCDNRLGVYTALEIAQNTENGLFVFGCYEEHGGGSVASIVRWMWDKFKINQTIISDITWVTDGVKHGKGAAISLRDSGIPRKAYLRKILALAKESRIPFQLEVESAGGSDGTEIQKSPYPIDWVFIGAPESYVHSPDEKVYLNDLKSMIQLTEFIFTKLQS